MSAEGIAALIIALGGGVFIRDITGGVWKWLTGRQRTEREAIQALDSERRYRAQVEEHAYYLRAQLIRLGHSDLVTAFPERPPQVPPPPATK